jgi:predicted RNase H-like HicB family nuclease
MAALTVIVEQDEEGFYVASCPALKGCWSQGRSEDEALASIREAIEGWLEAEEARARAAVRPGQRLREVALP